LIRIVSGAFRRHDNGDALIEEDYQFFQAFVSGLRVASIHPNGQFAHYRTKYGDFRKFLFSNRSHVMRNHHGEEGSVQVGAVVEYKDVRLLEVEVFLSMDLEPNS
jgi:hypothetical protein